MKKMKSFVKGIPGARAVYRALKTSYNILKSAPSPFLHSIPAGHFYSPLPDMREILERQDVLFSRDHKEFPGIDLKEREQLALLDDLSGYYNDLPFKDGAEPSLRYYYKNDFFTYGDAIALYTMIRHFKPARIIEVGSGFSSAAMLDTSDSSPGPGIHFTFIEPYPDRLQVLLNKSDYDNCRILKAPVQDVDPDLFLELRENDILFIDSSHVVKVGSDLSHIFFNVLPKLNPGVIIHFHDVYWPFEYPRECLLSGTAWNEAYFLRSFLQFNDTFNIIFFNSYIAEFHSDVLARKMPLFMSNTGASIWLRKVK